MTAYLLENKPRTTQFRKRRAKPTGLIVLHTAESHPDEVGPDDGCENVARFIRDRTTYGSYHGLADSDSRLRLVPYALAAFGDGTGSNEFAIHISAATQAARWEHLPPRWVNGCVRQMAEQAAEAARWLKRTQGITVPARRVSREESERGVPGFISHAERDPSRRTDPGKDFPWEQFFSIYRRLMSDKPKVQRSARFRATTWNFHHATPIKTLRPLMAEDIKDGVSVFLLNEAVRKEREEMLEDFGLAHRRSGDQWRIAWDDERWDFVKHWTVHGKTEYSAGGGSRSQTNDMCCVILRDQLTNEKILFVSYHTPAGVQLKTSRTKQVRRFNALREHMGNLRRLSKNHTRVCAGGDDNVDERRAHGPWRFMRKVYTGLRQVTSDVGTINKGAGKKWGRRIDDFRVKGLKPTKWKRTKPGGGDHWRFSQEFTYTVGKK